MERTLRQSSFTKELLLWMALLIVAPLGAIFAFFYRHEVSGWEQLEREKSLQASQAAQKSIGGLGERILGVTVTNGYWEDNRQAILQRDQAWLDENISDMPEVVPNVDFVAETDLEGNVLVQSGDVAEFSGRVKVPYVLQKFKNDKQFTGVVSTSKGIAVVAVSQVTGNKGEGSPAGLLITGHFITEEDLAGLKDTLQTDMAVLTQSKQFLSTSNELGADQLPPLAEMLRQSEGRFELSRGETYAASFAAALTDLSGEPVGIVYTRTPAPAMQQAAERLRIIGLYAAAGMLLLVVLVVTLLRHRIVVPLRHFTATLQEVAAGRPVTAMPKHIQQAEAQIVSAINQIMRWNHVLEQTVEERTAAVRVLLDNAKQGFMSIGADLRAMQEYSIECIRLFGRDIAGARLSDLFYPDDGQERALLDSILQEYFEETDESKKELYLSLLPEELCINGLTVRAEYKPLPGTERGGAAPQGELMVMLTDVTDTRKLESLMHGERKTLKMVVHVVTHPDDYAQIAHGFAAFASAEVPELLASSRTVEQKLLALCKSVHTMKGSFAFMHFIHIVPELHRLEELLTELLERPGGPSDAELAGTIRGLRLEEWMEKDNAILREVLGDAFAELGKEADVKLSRGQWQSLVGFLETRLTDEEGLRRLDEVRQWRYKPLRTLLQQYPAYLMELAARNGLLLRRVELEGGDIPVDPDRLLGLAQSLVHIVRNIVTHGIEPPEERIERGKDEYAHVRFAVERQEHGLVIIIEDDGRGINLEAVRRKAEERGIRIVSGSAAEPSDADIAELVFAERLSTTGEATEWSGRGVGLSAVKEEAEKLGGSVQVVTRLGQGTAFILRLPLMN